MGIYYTVVGKIKSMGKSIAMLQSNHRNASFVHSHIAVLQFAFFFLTPKNVAHKSI